MNWILPAALLTGFFLLRGGKRLKEQIQTQLLYKSAKISTKGVTGTFTLKVTNPTNAELTIKSIAGVLQYQGKSVANLVGLKTVEIKAKAVTDIDIDVNVTLRSMITEWIRNPKIWKELTAKYKVNTNAGVFDREEKISAV